ncbi:MAG: hypothetical protein ACE5HP_02595 [Gemmatimonadota bacterium]
MSADRRTARPARRPSCLGALFASCLAVLLGGCRGGEAAADTAAEAAAPELAIFVYDRSMSIPDYKLELARELTARRIATLHHGDRIAGLQVLQRSLAEPPLRWSQEIPHREFEEKKVAQDSVTLRRFQKDASDYLRSFSEPEGRETIMGTDLLSTFHDVAEELRGAPGRRATMYLFSDMLQSTPEIDMEGMRRMPEAGWVQAAAARGVLPDLRGLCVVVVGARVDTDPAQQIKSFWEEYFAATGARLEDRNYMLRPIRLPEDPC